LSVGRPVRVASLLPFQRFGFVIGDFERMVRVPGGQVQ
jgi:hypothetical protein